MTKTFVIVGPTCTGKTSLGIRLCQQFNGSIISADSRQVVRYMDIGTGKVPVREHTSVILGSLARRDDSRIRFWTSQNDDRECHREAAGRGDPVGLCTHTGIASPALRGRNDDTKWNVDGIDIYGYDLINPDEYFSAYDFAKYCKDLLSRNFLNGKTIFLVGGTGFYIDAVTGKLSLGGTGPDLAFRESLKGYSIGELQDRLKELDTEAYNKIDRSNPTRLVRAIEKASFWGVPLCGTTPESDSGCAPLHSAYQNDVTSPRHPEPDSGSVFSPVFIGLTADREVLYRRADQWIDGIFGEKLFEEVGFLRSKFPKSHRLNGLIYKSAISFLDGLLDLEEAKQQAKFDIHAYTRRQQTWFKRNDQIKWLDITQENFDSRAGSIVESELNG